MKKQVFHIITHFDLGGAEKVAFNIAKSSNSDIQYHLVSVVKAKGEFHDRFIRECKVNNIEVHESIIKYKKLAIFLFPVWFSFLFIKTRPNVIHTHTEIPDLSIYLWHLLFGRIFQNIKYCRTIHNTRLWSEWEKIGDVVESLYQKKYANIAISMSVRDSYKERYQDLPPVIFNGVEPVEQKPFPNIDDKKINVLFAGRLEYQKGIDELVSVVESLSDDDRFVFYIVGEGSMKFKIKKFEEKENIYMYDKIFGLSSYLSSFDYLFMPSNFEGFGLLSVEASLAKTPAIINKCPGLNETLPQDWSLAVENNNVDDYVKLFRMIKKESNCALGKIAFDYVNNKFCIIKMQHEYEEFYRK